MFFPIHNLFRFTIYGLVFKDFAIPNHSRQAKMGYNSLPMLLTLSHIQASPLLAAHQAGATAVALSLDLNRTTTLCPLSAEGLHLPTGGVLAWPLVQEVADSENACFHIATDDDGRSTLRKINFFSEALQRAYTLYPTHRAPTMLVSGITMHRIVDCDPHEDTLNKIKAAGKMTGDVLDTTMGLGYTAIMAAQTAASVLTIELDPTVEEVCRLNPWSQALFSQPNISRQIGHAWDVVETLPSDHFSVVLHDPPMFNMAGELYAQDFYAELYRVLKWNGRLFHYIGNPASKSGATTTRGAIRRLQAVGFRRVEPRPKAFGLLATK